MSFQRIRLGKEGEALALQCLKKNNYRIVERNYRTSLGEIDIIAWDRDTLCFIEVKTRRALNYASPFEAVSMSKQNKIVLLTQQYLQNKRLNKNNVRFDVVGIYLDANNQYHVDLLQNAFELPS